MSDGFSQAKRLEGMSLTASLAAAAAFLAKVVRPDKPAASLVPIQRGKAEYCIGSSEQVRRNEPGRTYSFGWRAKLNNR